MAVWERETQKLRYKGPSFSSSLLDAIYRSIDETRVANEHREPENSVHHRRNNAAQVEEDIESLRRAIMIEKWMESYSNSTTRSTPSHFPSNSASSTDSSTFSSSETESSASRTSPKSSLLHLHKPKHAQTPPKSEGRFTRTKSRAQKIYGELKKVKEPISPGGKIASFLNSIFSSRNMKTNQGMEEWSSMRKSRSMKDTATCALASRSCLSKNASSGGSKSKRSVRFCPVSVIVDEDCNPCGHKSIYNDEYSIDSHFIKKNIDSLRLYEGKDMKKNDFRGYYYQNENDLDDMSCASSDLFELENIGRVGIGAYEEELPVYGTTRIEMNQSIASGVVM